MASLVTANINLDMIPKEKLYQGKKGKYLAIVISLNNEVGMYGDSGAITVSQTMEEKGEKVPKIYLGNSKVVWTDGQNVPTAPRQEKGQEVAPVAAAAPSDLPF